MRCKSMHIRKRHSNPIKIRSNSIELFFGFISKDRCDSNFYILYEKISGLNKMNEKKWKTEVTYFSLRITDCS